jgi:hypothetical protein
MSISYQTRALDDEVHQAYRRLLPHQAQEIDAGKLAWKFRDQPDAPGVLATATLENRILGINGFMPSMFKIGESRILGYQSMDTVVDPEARGGGVFTNLVECFYRNDGPQLVYGFPNINSSRGFFTKLGWKHLGTPPFLIKVMRAGYFLRRLFRRSPALTISFPKNRGAERLLEFPEAVTESWRRFSKGIRCAVDRNATYLNWRLTSHPSASYCTFARQDSFVSTHITDKHGGRIGYVMEAIGGHSLGPTLETALHDLGQNGAEVVLAWCFPWSPNYPAYRANGFLPLPERFRPIKMNFGARSFRRETAFAEQAEAWYVSYLDSDTV